MGSCAALGNSLERWTALSIFIGTRAFEIDQDPTRACSFAGVHTTYTCLVKPHGQRKPRTAQAALELEHTIWTRSLRIVATQLQWLALASSSLMCLRKNRHMHPRKEDSTYVDPIPTLCLVSMADKGCYHGFARVTLSRSQWMVRSYHQISIMAARRTIRV